MLFCVSSFEGYNVTVLVRDPARLPADHRASRVVVGDVLNKDDVRKTMEGQDAVIIILGTRNDLSKSLIVTCHRPGVSNIRPEDQIRPLSSFHLTQFKKF